MKYCTSKIIDANPPNPDPTLPRLDVADIFDMAKESRLHTFLKSFLRVVLDDKPAKSVMLMLTKLITDKQCKALVFPFVRREMRGSKDLDTRNVFATVAREVISEKPLSVVLPPPTMEYTKAPSTAGKIYIGEFNPVDNIKETDIVRLTTRILGYNVGGSVKKPVLNAPEPFISLNESAAGDHPQIFKQAEVHHGGRVRERIRENNFGQFQAAGQTFHPRDSKWGGVSVSARDWNAILRELLLPDRHTEESSGPSRYAGVH